MNVLRSRLRYKLVTLVGLFQARLSEPERVSGGSRAPVTCPKGRCACRRRMCASAEAEVAAQRGFVGRELTRPSSLPGNRMARERRATVMHPGLRGRGRAAAAQGPHAAGGQSVPMTETASRRLASV